jgi:hypothetical protein
MSIVQPILLNFREMLERLEAYRHRINSAAYELTQAYAGTDPNKVFENGTFKSTTVALGSNPAVSSKPLLVPPTIVSGEITTDGLDNPYTILNFEIDQRALDGNQVISFRVYREEVPAEDLAQAVEMFTAADFDKLARGSTQTGKFAADKKSAYTIDEFKQSNVNDNTNLYMLEQISNRQQLGSTDGSFPDYFTTNSKQSQKKLIATISYADYQSQAQLKQVYVKTANKFSVSYSDHNVTYGTGYIYTVTSFCATSDESEPSESLSMVVLNLNGINPPRSMQVRQTGPVSAKLSVTIEPADLVKYVYVYRRNVNDLVFHPLAKLINQNNFVAVDDTDVEYLNSYVYRVLLENVFGAVSEPAEFNFTCSQQRIIGRTRSNNLQLPIILASQDQNSQGIKLTIFPNDHRILYYSLERRNLTAGETKYSTPMNKTKQFWPLNQFFVQPVSQSLLTSSSLAGVRQGSLPAQSQFVSFAAPIEFVDTIVAPDNYYEYRTTGYDLYGNITGYGFASLRAEEKNGLRSPVNFRAEVLRETPFRCKIIWQDDNEAARSEINNQAQQKYLALALQQASLSQDAQIAIADALAGEDLAKIDLTPVLAPYSVKQAQINAIQSELDALANAVSPLKFRLQRRLSGDAVYSSFPLTENNYVIDEVAAPDAIPFSTSMTSGSPQPTSSSALPVSSSLSRPFGLPDFMRAQQVYQYRVAAVTLDGGISDFSAPITVTASPQISDPTEFSASILNPRVKPVVVKLQWSVDPLKDKPDHWRIERKTDAPTDAYRMIGNAYLSSEYFDRSAQIGVLYSYRIRAVSAAGDESYTRETVVNT